MSVIKIFKENNLVFVIPYFIESKILSELRRQLEKDGFERPGSYHFSFHGVQISEYQENLIYLKDVTIVEASCDNRNILKLDIGTCENKKSSKDSNIGRKRKYEECHSDESEPENSIKPSTQEILSDDHRASEDVHSETTHKVAITAEKEENLESTNYECEADGRDLEEQSTSECSKHLADDSIELAELPREDRGHVEGKTPRMTISSFLRNPKPWEVKGIKIYSQQEVDTAVGYEKQRREFWNQEAKNLSRSTNLSREHIAKCINERWRKEKATILQNELDAKLASGVHQATPNTKKTVCKNWERVKELRDEITDVEENMARMEKGKNTDSGLLSRLKQKKSCLMSKLKKAQDCMRKNLKQI